MKLLLTTLSLAALARAAYPITGTTVNCRAGPTTDSAIKRTYKQGDMVTLTCQTEGPEINGNTIWDKTSDGCFVSDFFVKTGTSKYVADKCPSGSASASASVSVSASSSAEATTSAPATSAPPATTVAPTITPGGNSTVLPTGTASGSATPTAPVPAGAAVLEGKAVFVALPLALLAML